MQCHHCGTRPGAQRMTRGLRRGRALRDAAAGSASCGLASP